MKAILGIILLFICLPLLAQIPPVVSNVTATQRADGSGIVDIWYNLYDADGDICLVLVKLSLDNGQSYVYTPSFGNLSGDVGYNVASGNQKHIVWSSNNEGIRLSGSQYRFRVTADDGTSPSVPTNFVYVPGGTYHNGTGSVTVSSFWMDRYELTQLDYQNVMGKNPSHDYGIGINNPVYFVSWFDIVEYCNRRSIAEEIAPCYSYMNYGYNPDDWPMGWNTDSSNHLDFQCNWTSNGYRMPTLGEWLFAAKGGNLSQDFDYSGSNDLNQVAWWTGNSGGTTHPVAQKSPNELGIHDMSGNVWEWTWDIWSNLPTAPQTDPHGPVNGTCRTTRGGSYSTLLEYLSPEFNNNGGHADNIYTNTGARLVRLNP